VKIVNQREEIAYQNLGSVTYGSVLRFRNHSAGSIKRWPSSLGFSSDIDERRHWTKRTFVLADIWDPAESAVGVLDVTNGKCWKVNSNELVEVLDCELVLT